MYNENRNGKVRGIQGFHLEIWKIKGAAASRRHHPPPPPNNLPTRSSEETAIKPYTDSE